MRSIWTSRDTLWHETVFPLSFPASSGLKWVGREVAQSRSPTTGNLQSIPDSQTQLDPIDRGKCNGWNQMWGGLRKARRYLVLLPGKETKSWDSRCSRFSKVHALRAGVTFDMIPSDEICLRGHTFMGKRRTAFEQKRTGFGKKIKYYWYSSGLPRTSVIWRWISCSRVLTIWP